MGDLFSRVVPHLCPWVPLKEYLSMASSSRACFHHALPPLKHRAFLAVIRAQMRSQGAPLPLPAVADAVVRCQGLGLPPGVSARGMSHRALLYLRSSLRAQALNAWRGAGELLLARLGDRLKVLEQVQGEEKGEGKGKEKRRGRFKREDGQEDHPAEGSEWPFEAAVWSSRITTAEMRMALTLGDSWSPAPAPVEEEGKGEGADVMAGDPWWEKVMRGLAREAGVVDFDDGALHLLLQEWDKGLRAAVSGRRNPGSLNPAVEAAPLVGEEDEEAWPEPDDRGPPGSPRVWASDLRMALLFPKGKAPWPVAAGMYSPPNPPWPEVTWLVRAAMRDARTSYGWDAFVPSVGFMRLATQVGVTDQRSTAQLLADQSTPWVPPLRCRKTLWRAC
jgi:hypothetical protein